MNTPERRIVSLESFNNHPNRTCAEPLAGSQKRVIAKRLRSEISIFVCVDKVSVLAMAKSLSDSVVAVFLCSSHLFKCN